MHFTLRGFLARLVAVLAGIAAIALAVWLGNWSTSVPSLASGFGRELVSVINFVLVVAALAAFAWAAYYMARAFAATILNDTFARLLPVSASFPQDALLIDTNKLQATLLRKPKGVAELRINWKGHKTGQYEEYTVSPDGVTAHFPKSAPMSYREIRDLDVLIQLAHSDYERNLKRKQLINA